MNYKGAKVAISGLDNGFIATALDKRLIKLGAETYKIPGDIRDPETFKNLDYSYDYVFHFASPSSQVLFNRKSAYCIEATIKGLINVGQACQKHGIRLVYPSTGLLSQNRFNEYAMCKKLGEDYINGLNIDAIGIRIYATYGPGELHKQDYASVPYLFARDIINNRTPIIFGDGEQKRDFVYIDDVVEGILMAANSREKIVELGSGNPVSFNDLVYKINQITGKNIQPTYVDRPDNYIEITQAKNMLDGWYPRIKLDTGLAKMIDDLKHEGAN